MQIGIRLAMSFAMAMMVSGCSMRYEFYNYVSDGQETPYLDLSAELVGTVVARDEEGRRLVVTGNPYTLLFISIHRKEMSGKQPSHALSFPTIGPAALLGLPASRVQRLQDRAM